MTSLDHGTGIHTRTGADMGGALVRALPAVGAGRPVGRCNRWQRW
ncbi:MAG: hypothetical protein R3A10_16695 [Caldilineaceae bacterium]